MILSVIRLALRTRVGRSFMVTLKHGIENLLKHEVPGVKEVVAEEL